MNSEGERRFHPHGPTIWQAPAAVSPEQVGDSSAQATARPRASAGSKRKPARRDHRWGTGGELSRQRPA